MHIDDQIERLVAALERARRDAKPGDRQSVARVFEAEALLASARAQAVATDDPKLSQAWSRVARGSAVAAAQVAKALLAEDLADIEDRHAKNERVRAKMRALQGGKK